MPEAHWVSLYIASRGIPVASVDYRKALHGVRYPVPLDETIAAWLWVAGTDRPLGELVEHLHFGGASAGANLATAATQRLRDEGLPIPASLILAYPLVHSELPPLGEELTAALASNPPPINFTPTVVKAFNANYIGDVESATYAFPADGQVHGLPPVLIVNAEADEMRASGERFAQQLASEGVDVSCVTQMGTQHGFLDQPRDAGAVDAMDGFLAHMARLG
jgi:acetyl esterase/lipase